MNKWGKSYIENTSFLKSKITIICDDAVEILFEKWCYSMITTNFFAALNPDQAHNCPGCMRAAWMNVQAEYMQSKCNQFQMKL